MLNDLFHLIFNTEPKYQCLLMIFIAFSLCIVFVQSLVFSARILSCTEKYWNVISNIHFKMWLDVILVDKCMLQHVFDIVKGCIFIPLSCDLSLPIGQSLGWWARVRMSHIGGKILSICKQIKTGHLPMFSTIADAWKIKITLLYRKMLRQIEYG